MKHTPLPTAQEIDALTAFLPLLYAEGFSPIKRWNGGQTEESGSIKLPYPTYNPVVTDFFRLASSECWRDYEYRPHQAAEMLHDENMIKAASLSQIKTMLTFCVRGEKFTDGHWGTMVEKGYVRRLLERLKEIRLTG